MTARTEALSVKTVLDSCANAEKERLKSAIAIYFMDVNLYLRLRKFERKWSTVHTKSESNTYAANRVLRADAVLRLSK